MHDLMLAVRHDRSETEVARPHAVLGLPRTKRALDVFGSTVGLVLLSPFFLALSIAIKLDSPGPVLFRQTRVGFGGRPFQMLKFRTMRDGSDNDIHRRYVTEMIRTGSEELRNGHGTYKLENDERITRVGRWLRTHSLDEFPQLINVLRGEMSLVGPRPPLPYEVELYTPRHSRRLDGLPGMTGLWQVSGRNETTFEEMVDLDISYLESWTPLLDVQILARTVSVVLSEKGA